MRQRKSCLRSSSVGALKLVIRTPCGSTSPIVWRSTPPLPLVSMPCSTSRTRRSEPDGALGPEPLLQVGELGTHRERGPPCRRSSCRRSRARRRSRSRSGRPVRRAGAGRRRCRRVMGTSWPTACTGRGRGARRACSRRPLRSMPSRCGSSNQVPRVNPALARIRSDARVAVVGRGEVGRRVGESPARVQHPRPQHAAPSPRPRHSSRADGVVDADGVRVGREDGELRVVADPVVLHEPDRPAVDLDHPHPGRGAAVDALGRTSSPRSARGSARVRSCHHRRTCGRLPPAGQVEVAVASSPAA